jgi:hypothetical protein
VNGIPGLHKTHRDAGLLVFRLAGFDRLRQIEAHADDRESLLGEREAHGAAAPFGLVVPGQSVSAAPLIGSASTFWYWLGPVGPGPKIAGRIVIVSAPPSATKSCVTVKVCGVSGPGDRRVLGFTKLTFAIENLSPCLMVSPLPCR